VQLYDLLKKIKEYSDFESRGFYDCKRFYLGESFPSTYIQTPNLTRSNQIPNKESSCSAYVFLRLQENSQDKKVVNFSVETATTIIK